MLIHLKYGSKQSIYEVGVNHFRLDADTCLLWHIPSNACQLPNSPLYNVCKLCKTLHHNIQVLAKRVSSTADETKALAACFDYVPIWLMSDEPIFNLGELVHRRGHCLLCCHGGVVG